MLNNEIIFYGGMPRSGSHLLSGILNQNPLFHSEGSSALCRILWDVYQCMNDPITESELKFFDRDGLDFQKKIQHSIINSYYENIKNKIVLEKNRSWTIKENIDLIKNVVDDNPKFIIMTRDVEEIVKSFVKIHLINGYDQKDVEQIVLNFNERGINPLMRPIAATVWAKLKNDNKNFLFIDYKNVCDETHKVIKDIYDFIGIDYFNHDLKNIEMKYKENSHLIGLADVRKTISKQENSVVLSNLAKEKIEYIKHIIKLCDYPEQNIKDIEEFYYNNC